MSEGMENIPRVISHRDFTPGNIKTVPEEGCIMLDWSTLGVSTIGADEGRWYVHYALDEVKQRDILDNYMENTDYDQTSLLSLLLTIGMRSAREYKMMQEGAYYDKHLGREFPDEGERRAFRNTFEQAMLNQLAWTNRT